MQLYTQYTIYNVNILYTDYAYYIYKYIYTRLHNFPMLVKDNYMAHTTTYTLLIFHIHHFANCQYSPLILDKSCEIL